MEAAGRHGTGRSFDLNYRSKVEPDKQKARKINRGIVPHVDFLLGNQDDFSDALGFDIQSPGEDEGFDQRLEVYVGTLRAVSAEFRTSKLIGTQLRGALSADRINWGAVLYDVEHDTVHQATIREGIEIADRTGGGDSFAAGVIAALLQGRELDVAVQWGAAHGILVQETPGDTSMVTQQDVEKEVDRALKGGGVSAPSLNPCTFAECGAVSGVGLPFFNVVDANELLETKFLPVDSGGDRRARRVSGGAAVPTLLHTAVWYNRAVGGADMVGVYGNGGGLAMALFAPVWGYLADRFGAKPMVVRSMVGGGIAVLLMSQATTIEQLFAARIFHGMMAGSVTACVILVSKAAPRSDWVMPWV